MAHAGVCDAGGRGVLRPYGEDLAYRVPTPPVKTAADFDVPPADEEPYSVRLASKYVSIPLDQTPADRRQYSRRRDRDLDWIKTVRLRSAGQVSLVDLSAGGALIDAAVPLRPGSTLTLEIIGQGLETVVPLQVLRSHVAALNADSARYRGACEFARPIELPGLHAMPDQTGSSVDSFVGVDAALKRLVERAYAADPAQRLATGDVLMVLQSVSQRALNVNDPFGRHVGMLLQELLPALRHSHPLTVVIATIERQLQQALPDARLRLDAARTPAPQGTRSVVIGIPGAAASERSVSIDLPSSAPVNDAQARMLRASSRLIALVQCLPGFTIGAGTASESIAAATAAPPPATPPPADPDALAVWQKVVVRYADGKLLKGFTQDFHGSKSQFSLWPSINASSAERVVVPLALLKAIFFVREFGGNPDHVEQKVFDGPAHGRRIEVTLLDDEVLVGTTLNYRTDSTGFFIMPADARANNQRVFVVSSAVRQLRFP